MASTPHRLPKTRTSSLGVWALVAIPAIAILICGILILVYQQSVFEVTIGLLLVTFCAALGAGATLTLVGIRQDRRLAALQIDFVSKVSHELKTPLTSIRMFVDTLRMGRVTERPQIEHCLEVISKETDRLSLLIGRLLSWGAMEAGAFKLDRQPVDVKRIVSSAVEVFQPQLHDKKVQLLVQVEDDLPVIQADASSMIDALINLLTNALKYRGASERIELSARARNGRIELSVRDFGMGIAKREQPRIFERFYRSESRDVKAISGTGLGLAIARHVVLAHGGTLELDSKVDEGSTFTIVVPVEPNKERT
jgi:two-component system, OmpR family, phosphate regulon sensor histidine kinase PhoR